MELFGLTDRDWFYITLCTHAIVLVGGVVIGIAIGLGAGLLVKFDNLTARTFDRKKSEGTYR